ncbi:MAG TPA: nucleotidyltransferase domain-containing protein [Planctomycetota bacterium]|nr:nucleotidyltransferase domain-containing protein [Planctomycetota bacterium]HRR81553.1 nucleotidyltransferase domain-containing protein [Planctomycetota bacterium]HRT93404.1 nucleotidyltransferase domain-containing protein [Planctomycetota bacterium]
MHQPEQLLREVVARIRRTIDPDRVILFGSRARGDEGPDSDLDILVVAPSPLPRWKRTVPLYRVLAGLGVPKDVVWWTPDEIDEWRAVRSHFITTALREGRVLYERPA